MRSSEGRTDHRDNSSEVFWLEENLSSHDPSWLSTHDHPFQLTPVMSLTMFDTTKTLVIASMLILGQEQNSYQPVSVNTKADINRFSKRQNQEAYTFNLMYPDTPVKKNLYFNSGFPI